MDVSHDEQQRPGQRFAAWNPHSQAVQNKHSVNHAQREEVPKHDDLAPLRSAAQVDSDGKSQVEQEQSTEEDDDMLRRDFDVALQLYRSLKEYLTEGIEQLQRNVGKVEKLLRTLYGEDDADNGHDDTIHNEGGCVSPSRASANSKQPFLRHPLQSLLPPEVQQYLDTVSLNDCFDSQDRQLLESTLKESQKERDQLIRLREQLDELYMSMTAILLRREEIIVMHEQEIFHLSPQTLEVLAEKQRQLHALLISNLKDISQEASLHRRLSIDHPLLN